MVTGAITAVIVFIVIYAWAALRPIPPIDADFGSRTVSFTTAVPPDEAFRIVETVPPGAGYKLGRADASRRRVILHDGMTMTSFGFFYPVDIAAEADGRTQVTVGIKSKYPLQFGPIVRRQQERANARIADALRSRIETGRLSA